MREAGPAPARPNLAGYLPERLLKEGQGVATWRGVDLKDGSPVILKLAELSPGARLRLEHEAEVLRTLRCPWVPPLLHWGTQDSQLFLVLRYVPGLTLQDRLLRGRLSVAEALTLGRCLFEALAAAHEQGVLHRDIKPTNLVVDEPLTRATLLDFGLARSLRLPAGVRDLPVGTALYTSPEQAGLVENDVGPRSDLYSAGVVLFECLAGRPPFQAERVGEVLRMHVTRHPPDLRSLGVAVPRVLDEVVQRLLRKDPRERYQSARAVVDDLGEMAGLLEAGVAEPDLVVGLSDLRHSLAEPAFVGRSEELETLTRALERRRGVVALEAPSGGGKSRLLEEVGQRAARAGAWVLRGQARDRNAPVPFQELEGVASALLSAADLEPGLGDAVRQRLGAEHEAMAAALPRLAPLMGAEPSAALGPEAHGEVRSLRALAALLHALGSPSRPAVVIIDDYQWAEDMSVRLLDAFAERAGEGDCHTLLLVAWRTEEVPADHPLRTVPYDSRVDLCPLSEDEVRALVESMAGSVPDEVHPVVARLAEGNPFMAAEVLRGMVEVGALVPRLDGWTVDPAVLGDVRSSRRAAEILARRLDLLPEDARRLLAVAAVVGKEFDLDFVADLAGVPPGRLIPALDEARRRQLLWADAQGTRYAFVHDRVREALLERLAPEERRPLHLAAARRLDPARVYEISYHYDQAGEFEKALPFALEAAEEARGRNALEIAEQHYRIALRGAGGAEAAVRQGLAEGLGDVLMLRGRYREAEERFEEARSLARGEAARARIESKLGELAFKKGDMQAASEALERGLKLLGRWVPRSTPWLVLGLLREVLVQALHSLLPRFFVGVRRLDGAEDDLLAVRLYSRMAYAWWFQRGAVPTLWAHLRELNLAEAFPPTRELGQAYANHAPVMTVLPWFTRAIRYGQKSVAIRTALGDMWGRGQSLHFLGTAWFASSRYREALDTFREAVRLLERTGDRWEVNAARYHVAFAHYRLGHLREAVETSRQVHHAGLAIGDFFASGASLNVWSKASGGRVPEGALADELARPSLDAQRNAEVHQAEGLRLLGAGRPAEAAVALQEAWGVARRAGLRTEYVASIPAWEATAWRLAAEGGADTLPQARVACRRALALARNYPNNKPHALRESGWLAAMDGRMERARGLLAESLRIADHQQALYEVALTRQARGRLGSVLGWPESVEDADLARRLMVRLGAAEAEELEEGPEPVTLSLADRFATVLEAGRRIASALSPEAVWEAVGEASRVLLRGERWQVLEVSGDHLVAVAGDGDLEYSRSLTMLAISSGRPVRLREGPEENPTASQVFFGLRSALCAPISVRGQVTACLHVMNRQVGRLFGEEEERLAEFIATLAGAALENARGFAEVGELSESLQRTNEDLQTSLSTLRETQERLLHTERMAVAGRVAGGVAHDFNNLLTIVTGYAELLLAQLPSGDALRPELEEIRVAGERGTALTRRLLAFSRRQVMHARIVDLNAIVVRVERILGRVVGEDVRIVTRLTGDLGSVRADPAQLEQVLMNLAINARDAMPGGGTLTFATWPDGDQVVLEVTDTGCGFDADTRSRVFEPFFTTKPPGQGTGLGLATVYGIVQQSGGRVEVESEPGEGTTFRIALPRVEQQPEEVSATPPPPLERGSGTVLLVEDEAPVRTLVRTVLRRSGYRVLEAADGPEALRVLNGAAERVDLLVTDVVMPGMSGPELAQRMAISHPDTRVLFMSGYPDDDLIQRGLFQEKPKVITKPFTPVELTRKIREVLE